MHPFSTPWKHQKTLRFPMFSGGTERVHWERMGWKRNSFCFLELCFIFNNRIPKSIQITDLKKFEIHLESLILTLIFCINFIIRVNKYIDFTERKKDFVMFLFYFYISVFFWGYWVFETQCILQKLIYTSTVLAT